MSHAGVPVLAGRAAARVLTISLVLTAAAATPHAARAGALRAHAFEEGVASWYGGHFHGRQTASGERFDKRAMTAAHRTLPFDTVLLVTNLENGREARLRVTDRGPFVSGRILDCSEGAAEVLGFRAAGLARVRLEILGQVPEVDGRGLTRRQRRRLIRQLERASRRGRAVAEAEAPPTPVPSGLVPVDPERGPFVVQVGAFGDRRNAERLADRLRRAGHRVQISSGGADGLSRVRVGPHPDRAAAERAAEVLRRQGLPTFVARADPS